MGSCHSSNSHKKNLPFDIKKRAIPNAYKFPDTNSTQFASKKDVLILNQCQQEPIDLESLSICSEEIINIPYLFNEKIVDRNKKNLNPSNKHNSLSKSLHRSSHYKANKLQKFALSPPIKKKIEIREYFKPEFYNQMFNDVMKENLNSYDGYECLHKETNSNLKLQIHLLSYKNSKNSNRISKFRTEFIAPCTAKQYIETANNLEAQKVLDTYCDENKILESLTDNIKLLYLSYRKTILSSPRDFVYLKMIKNVEHNGKNYWCDASRSIDTPCFPTLDKVMRCLIIKSGHLIEDLSTEKESKCLVKIYSECDMRIDLPLFVIRNFSASEMKKFVEKTIRKVQEFNKKK